MTELAPTTTDALLRELRQLIEGSRGRVAQAVNSELVLLYWQGGRRLRDEVVGEERGAYGRQVVEAIAAKLTAEFGRGFGARNLYHMMRFAEVFPESEILYAVRSELTWTHIRAIIAIEDPLKRQFFYTELCRLERWSTRTLKQKIDGMLFERTAIAKRPEQVVEQALGTLRDDQQLSPDLVFRDPYVLDFLKLPADFSEQELETAILRELESFLLELGQGFSFIARQKRMSIGADDFYLDLLSRASSTPAPARGPCLPSPISNEPGRSKNGRGRTTQPFAEASLKTPPGVTTCGLSLRATERAKRAARAKNGRGGQGQCSLACSSAFWISSNTCLSASE